MTDIVERLRQLAEREGDWVMGEAADEIERLRAELDRETVRYQTEIKSSVILMDEIEGLRAENKRIQMLANNEIERLRKVKTPASMALLSITKGCLDGANREIEELEAEIERLRAALESLTHDPPATFAREHDTDDEVIIKMRAIARAALETKA